MSLESTEAGESPHPTTTTTTTPAFYELFCSYSNTITIILYLHFRCSVT